jgi:hypothetical protein
MRINWRILSAGHSWTPYLLASRAQWRKEKLSVGNQNPRSDEVGVA